MKRASATPICGHDAMYRQTLRELDLAFTVPSREEALGVRAATFFTEIASLADDIAIARWGGLENDSPLPVSYDGERTWAVAVPAYAIEKETEYRFKALYRNDVGERWTEIGTSKVGCPGKGAEVGVMHAVVISALIVGVLLFLSVYCYCESRESKSYEERDGARIVASRTRSSSDVMSSECADHEIQIDQ